ncbi:rab9 effector protein with kelch motifs-like isoform X1 [Centruroides vittatus]|uniref:rab9 effector protein with kelch motifs-like isoform X1 n=1 Tax=Centruroides vittatus TaxID=120091 RepID=UPI0035100D22
MEFISSFDTSILNRPSGWYEIKTLTKGPYPRGGHTGIYVTQLSETASKEMDDKKGKIFLIGGADPDRAFDQSFVLDLNNMTWTGHSSGSFCGRYEHSCYIPTSYPDKIYIFGGADLTGNRNDIQVLDTNTMVWTTVEVDGCQPSPRTQHHSAAFGDYLVVFGGGDCGANPVSDCDVHIFNATTQSWSILTATGNAPSVRHGHAMVSLGNLIYVHGGMSGPTFYDDFYTLDMENCMWKKLSPKGRNPTPRAAHSIVAINKQLFLFGGLSNRGALNDLYRFDTVEEIWVKISVPGKLPSARLDFAICAINIELIRNDEKGSTDGQSHPVRKASPSWLSNTISFTRNDVGFLKCWCFSGGMQLKPSHSEHTSNIQSGRSAIFLHGGMDTQGNIFDDFFIYLL